MNRFAPTLLVSMAFVFLTGMTGAVYAGSSSGPAPQCGGHGIDLKIRDQDEPWRDGVSGTWVARNMAPGQVLDFSGAFVGLTANSQGRISVSACYGVIEEQPVVEADTDPNTNRRPDLMARKLTITRCRYSYGGWQIDCLTGEPSGMTAREKRSYDYRPGGWRIQDADHDGRITVNDLKLAPLGCLPLPGESPQSARFVMSLQFAPDAGNDLQGDTLDLTMSYTLRSW